MDTITQENRAGVKVQLAYFTETTSAGATGKGNIKVIEDCTFNQLEDLARGEIKRRINAICRESKATVLSINGCTMAKPYEYKLSAVLAGRGKVDMAEFIIALRKAGKTPEEICNLIAGEDATEKKGK